MPFRRGQQPEPQLARKIYAVEEATVPHNEHEAECDGQWVGCAAHTADSGSWTSRAAEDDVCGQGKAGQLLGRVCGLCRGAFPNRHETSVLGELRWFGLLSRRRLSLKPCE